MKKSFPMIKILAVSLCVFVSQILVTLSICAEAPEENWGKDYGISIKWIEPGEDYRTVRFTGEPEGGYAVICATDSKLITRYGIADSDGNIVVPFMYEHITPLSENTHLVRAGDKCGVINSVGEIIVPGIYEEVFLFSEGQYFVRTGSMKKVIDATGKEILDLSRYDAVGGAVGGFSVVTLNGKCGLIAKQAEILPCEYDNIYLNDTGLILAFKDGFHTLFDKDGKSKTTYETIETSYTSDVLIKVGRGGKYGVLDKFGNEVIPCVYPDVKICDDDIIAVFEEGWKYINVNDKSNAYYYAGSFPNRFSDGLARVYSAEKRKYGYINKAFELVIPFKYSYAWDFEDGMAKVSDVPEAIYYLIDKNGAVKVPHKEYEVEMKGGILAGKYYTKVYSGLIPPLSDNAVLDGDGNRITEFIYSEIQPLENGMVKAWKNGEGCGLINKKGEEVTPFVFENIEYVGNNKCTVSIMDDSDAVKAGILTLPEDAAEREASFARPITVYVNGLDLYFDTEPVIKNDRVLVPMRKIFETLGCTVSWEQASNAVTAAKGDITIQLTIGEENAYVSGEALTLDSPAILENNRTLVPIRFIAETLGLHVDWNEDARRVSISA